MTRLLADLAKWWRWRVQRSQGSLVGLEMYREIGTASGREKSRSPYIPGEVWSVDRGEFGTVYAVARVDVNIGDRVEIEPLIRTYAAGRWNMKGAPEWVIVRKVGTQQSAADFDSTFRRR